MNARMMQIVRSVAVIGGTGALIVGATMAATNSVSLTGNTFSASVGLQIAKDVSNTQPVPGFFKTTVTGFDFNTLHVGQDSAAQSIWLKNTSGGALSSVAVFVPTLPTLTGTDADHVHVTIKEHLVPAVTITKTLTELHTGAGATLTSALANNGAKEYDVSVNVDVTADNAEASSTGFDLNFTGQ